MKFKTTLAFLPVFLAIFGLSTMNAQVKTSFAPRYEGNLRGDFRTIGNTTIGRSATGNYNGDNGNQDFDDNVFVDIDNDGWDERPEFKNLRLVDLRGDGQEFASEPGDGIRGNIGAGKRSDAARAGPAHKMQDGREKYAATYADHT